MNGYCVGDVCSDNFPMIDVENNFDLRIKDFNFVIKKKMKSEEFVLEIEDNSLDFVYIDDIHTYDHCSSNIKMWYPKIKKSGWIGGHDYHKCFLGVIKAVNEFKKIDYIFDDSSWLIKKD
jgi:hypothetical protein